MPHLPGCQRLDATSVTVVQCAGAQKYWIVDRFAHRVVVWRFDEERAIGESYGDNDLFTRPLLPDPAIPVRDLWPWRPSTSCKGGAESRLICRDTVARSTLLPQSSRRLQVC